MSQPVPETLYHGTIFRIDRIDVSKGRNNKDFGRGFYMAMSRSQAIGMMHKKYRESMIRRGNGGEQSPFSERLYKIEIDAEAANSLNVRYFEQADMEWLDFILKCRERGGTPHDYDLVIGPTADDNTLLCLRTYWQEFYGEVGSCEAKEILLRNLEPENLGRQCFIGKQDIADRVIKGFEEIDWGRL